MTIKEIKDVLSNTAYKDANIYSYKHLTGGLMNTIWRVDTSLGCLIVKVYDLKRNLYTANKAMSVWKNFVNVPEPIHSNEISLNGKNVKVYKYISGDEISRPNHYQLEQITNIIKACTVLNDEVNDDIIFKCDIVDKQYNELKELNDTKIDNNVVKDVIKGYELIKDEIRNRSKYIGHHDLNHGNVLWLNSELFGVIDFDEASICTKEYELVVFATKHCMIEDNFDNYYLYEILKQFYGTLNNDIINDYKLTFKFYTLKVLLEKIYLYQNDIVDIYNERQMRDNWNWWYKLYKSVDSIMDSISQNI